MGWGVTSSLPVRVASLMVLAAVVLVAARGLIGGAGASESAALQAEKTSGVVSGVIDGDTVDVEVSGQGTVRVRLLGVDAPEVEHRGEAGECFGREAGMALERLLPVGSRVTLVSDPSQDVVDVYGRWLRYVHLGGDDVGRALIRAGDATALEGRSSVTRAAGYRRAEQRAQDQRLGLWAACG